MSLPNLIKNIASKDKNISENTIKTLINTRDIEAFRELTDKSEFIFPFLREKISKNFVKLINENNIDTIFEFAKIYSSDFEDLIVNAFLKFANEDLTDRILEMFENGSDDEKTYAAKYFSYIKDPLALEFLNNNSKSDFLPLKMNCAKALREFNDVTILNEMKEIVSKSNDEFEKMSAIEFILSYNGEEQIKFVLNNSINSPFISDIVSNILDFNDFYTLKNILQKEDLNKIFAILIENYPENIPLNTISYYSIYDFTKYAMQNENSYMKNVLALMKKNFSEYLTNDVYSFDLDKNTKDELKRIVDLLNSYNVDLSDIAKELNPEYQNRFKTALRVIKEYKLEEYIQNISDILNKKDVLESLKAECAQVLHDFSKPELIKLELIESFKNEDLKAFMRTLV